MPTPSDSTDELLLPSQIEQSLHSSCPPEIDRPSEWRTQVLDRLSRAGSHADIAVAAMAVAGDDETLPQPRRLSIDEDQSDSPSRGTENAEFKGSKQVVTKGVEIITSTITSESTTGCQVDEKHVEESEQEQAYMTAPTSSILDLPYSTRLGLHSSRVRINEKSLTRQHPADTGLS